MPMPTLVLIAAMIVAAQPTPEAPPAPPESNATEQPAKPDTPAIMPLDFSLAPSAKPAAPKPAAAPARGAAAVKPVAPARTAAPAAPDPGERAALAALKVAQAAKFRGTLLVGSGEDSYTLIVGVPDGERPFDNGDGRWRWASITKQIVAVLALMEVENGRLALDESVAKHLGGMKLPNADTITLRQLLQHTTGLASDEDGPKDAEGRPLVYAAAAPEPPEDAIPPACLAKPRAAPGDSFQYNNCDYLVVGRILESVTGRPLSVLLAERITVPLGMTETRLAPPGQRLTTPAGPDAAWTDDGYDETRFGAAAATTGPARDLFRFDRALASGKLLKPEMLAELWRGNPKLGYAALGSWTYTVPLKGCAAPVRLVERRGAIGNAQALNVIAPDTGRVLIAFTTSPAEFGEIWQGKGLSYDLLSAAVCTGSAG
ncbi:MAG: serine hydrolase domain-containing protein [Sphingomonadaceae bacterium]|nr:serine hydrolase domain-containing protein [Sphingomonadaceae bacterium]